MSIGVTERQESRTNETGPTGPHERVYDVDGTDDYDLATLAVDAAIDPTIDGRPLQKIRLEPIGHEMWLAVARWQVLPSGGIVVPSTGEIRISGRTSGGRKHITQAKEHLETVGHPAVDPASYPNHNGALNVTEDGVDGVEIFESVDEFIITRWIADADFAAARAADFKVKNRMNDALWRGYEPGELFYRGMSYSYRQSHNDWQCDYEFSARPNEEDVKVFKHGADPTDWVKLPFVRGWDYIWVEYRDVVNNPFTPDAVKARQPMFAHSARVYDTADFTLLGLT